MESPSRTHDIQALLEQRSWVRQLACRLAVDADAVDDLEQETWLAALRRPPRIRTTVRSWLGGVVRNLARQSRRTESRRIRRETAVDGPAAPGIGPDDLAARREEHARVVEAVLALPAPLREVVLLRFFDDLPTREVARAVGVPYDTTRSRLKAAMARLREALATDAESPRQRRSRASLAWLLGVLDHAPAGRGVGPSATVKGVLIVTTAQKTAFVAAFVLLPLLSAGVAFVAATSGAETRADGERAAIEQRLDRLERQLSAARAQTETHQKQRVEDRVAVAASPDATAAPSLDDRVRKLEDEIVTLRTASETADAAARSAQASVPVDLSRLHDEELLARARKLSGFATAAESIPVWNAVLERVPSDAVAGEALFKTGMAHAFLGEQAAAESFYRRAIDLVGLDAPDGQNAAYQLGLVLRLQGKYREACEQITAFAADRRVDVGLAVQALLFGAPAALSDGDPALARSMYRRVLDLLGDRVRDPDDTQSRTWAERATRAIELIDRQ